MGNVNSYDRDAKLPGIGSIWVWELDLPHARALCEVVEVKWNGEEWWVATRKLLPHNLTYPGTGREVEWNDVRRFWEAVTPVRGRNMTIDREALLRAGDAEPGAAQ